MRGVVFNKVKSMQTGYAPNLNRFYPDKVHGTLRPKERHKF